MLTSDLRVPDITCAWKVYHNLAVPEWKDWSFIRNDTLTIERAGVRREVTC